MARSAPTRTWVSAVSKLRMGTVSVMWQDKIQLEYFSTAQGVSNGRSAAHSVAYWRHQRSNVDVSFLTRTYCCT